MSISRKVQSVCVFGSSMLFPPGARPVLGVEARSQDSWPEQVKALAKSRRRLPAGNEGAEMSAGAAWQRLSTTTALSNSR